MVYFALQYALTAGEVTLLREHCQGPNEMMFVLPTGGFDPRKHTDWLQCAKSELSEEACPSFCHSPSPQHPFRLLKLFLLRCQL